MTSSAALRLTRPAAPQPAPSGDPSPSSRPLDAASPNRNLAPLTTHLDGPTEPEVGGCDLGELARTLRHTALCAR